MDETIITAASLLCRVINYQTRERQRQRESERATVLIIKVFTVSEGISHQWLATADTKYRSGN